MPFIHNGYDHVKSTTCFSILNNERIETMQKLLRLILSASRKRRIIMVGVVIWLLQMIRDIEEAELYRNSDMLDKFDAEPEGVSRRKYIAIEEECSNCECALGFLESVIEDLEFAY